MEPAVLNKIRQYIEEQEGAFANDDLPYAPVGMPVWLLYLRELLAEVERMLRDRDHD